MTVKLVRTDALDAVKIKLTRGEHVIGRGKLLNCDEKRISRQHGELLVNDDSITIKALHLNPCFFLKKSSTEVEILRLGNSVTLNNGDRFGLLPDTYWYKVLLHQDVDESENIQSENSTEEYLEKPNDNGQSPSKNNDVSQMRSITPDSPSMLTAHNESTQIQQNTSISPQLDQNEPELQSPDTEAVAQQPDIDKIPNTTIEVKKEKDESECSPPVKRAHSQDNTSEDVDVKKIKTENAKEEAKSDDEKPGTSDQAAAAKPPHTVNDGGPSNNIPNRVRERCMYGANCYRKNPQHMTQFSHPRDADWGPGERGACPYGAACGKRDPRHWRDHDHPPGTVPPPQPGMRVVERRGQIIYINAHTVNFYEDHFEVEDQDGDSVDYDYEF